MTETVNIQPLTLKVPSSLLHKQQSMNKQPTLLCERLLLRPFSLEDVPEVTVLVGERDIASTTLAIPHPYATSMAEDWISKHRPLAI